MIFILYFGTEFYFDFIFQKVKIEEVVFKLKKKYWNTIPTYTWSLCLNKKTNKKQRNVKQKINWNWGRNENSAITFIQL